MSKRELFISTSDLSTALVLPVVAALLLFAYSFLSTPFNSLSTLAPAERDEPPSAPLAVFTDETFIRGINHQHNERSREIVGLDDTLGAGVCPLDADGDGWIDLFFVGGSGTHRYYGKNSWWSESPGNRLYINDGKGYFSPASTDSGLQDPVPGMGCATADLDNDGDHDIVVTAVDGVYLYENIGEGTFKRKRLTPQGYWAVGVALSDVNNDGLLDIYIGNFVDYSHYSPKYEGFTGHLVEQDNNLDSRAFTPRPNFLLINEGGLVFTDRAEEYGVTNRDGRSVFAAFYDLNGDGKDDLLVGNKEGSRSKVYLYDGGKFVDQTTSTDYPFPKNFHDFVAADLTGNGHRELIFSGPSGQPLAIYQREATGYRDISSSYLENPTAVYATEKFALTELDLNGDEFVDLVVTGGYPAPDLDSSAMALGQNDLFVLNQGFTRGSVTRTGGRLPKSGRGLLAIDIDNDGDRDLIITNNNDFPTVLINGSDKRNRSTGAQFYRDNNYLGTYRLSMPPQSDYSAAPTRDPANEILHYPKFLGISLLDEDRIGLHQLHKSFGHWSNGEQLRALSRISSHERRDLRLALLDHGLNGSPDVALYSALLIIEHGIPGYLDRILDLAITSEDPYGCAYMQLVERLFEIEERFIRQRKALAAALSAEVDALPIDRQICAAAALGYSRSKRPIDRLAVMAASDNLTLSLTAIQALSRLKHGDALKSLEMLNEETAGKRQAGVRKAIAIIQQGSNPLESEFSALFPVQQRSCVPSPPSLTTKLRSDWGIYCKGSVNGRRIIGDSSAGIGENQYLPTEEFKGLEAPNGSPMRDIDLARLLMKNPPPWLAEEILRKLVGKTVSPTIRKTLDYYIELETITLESRIIAASLLPMDDGERRNRLAKLIKRDARG